MAERIKADIYITYLDKLLAGNVNTEPIEDVELEKLLLLSKTMIAEDLSVNSKMRESLRKELLAQVINKLNISVFPSKDDELDEEALKQVVAAGQARDQKDICPYCGSMSTKFERKCPFCSY